MNILVGYKGLSFGKDLLELSAVHAKAFDATVLVVASVKGAEDDDQEKIDKINENLEQAKRFLDEKGVKCETHLLVHGLDAGEDLVAFCKEKDAFEIIVGIKSRSKVGKLIFGSTAQEVILTATCPVVAVRGSDN